MNEDTTMVMKPLNSSLNDLCFDICINIGQYLTLDELLRLFHRSPNFIDIVSYRKRQLPLHLVFNNDARLIWKYLPNDLIDSLTTSVADGDDFIRIFSRLKSLTLTEFTADTSLSSIEHLSLLKHLSLKFSSVIDPSLTNNRSFNLSSCLIDSLVSLEIHGAFVKVLGNLLCSRKRSMNNIKELRLNQCDWPVVLRLMIHFPHIESLDLQVLCSDETELFHPFLEEIFSITFQFPFLSQLAMNWTDIDIDSIAKLLSYMPALKRCSLIGRYESYFQRKFIELDLWRKLTLHCYENHLLSFKIDLTIPLGLNPARSLPDANLIEYWRALNSSWEIAANVVKRLRTIKMYWPQEIL